MNFAGNNGKLCTVTDVTIQPCPEAAKNEPCKIKRGEYASIAFQYKLGIVKIYVNKFNVILYYCWNILF